MRCEKCNSKENQVKNGKNPSGSQRWYCKACERVYTPKASAMYGEEKHRQAVRMYLEGMSFRAIGRLLEVHHQTVINWIEAHAKQLPDPASDIESVEVIELDELFTFAGKKSPQDTESTS